ncbi:hypothetical protein F4808DRAFT_420556 [Astrocystis sublimbata]|nr:hypothetical protein F4808DRAFT_420556 [Astrocystis sublimbata]
MSSTVPANSPATGGRGSDDDDDDDDLSITSSYAGDNDSEKEWEVDDILAERQHPSHRGAMQYLIRWQGFELQDCTWEPIENLGDGLLSKWDENKAEIESGSRQSFDLATLDAALAARAQRHARRNAKRRRLGLPLTPPFPPKRKKDRGTSVGTSVASPSVLNVSDSDDEAREVVDIDHDIDHGKTPSTARAATTTTKTSTPKLPLPTPKGSKTPKKVAKQKTFIGIPSQSQKDVNKSRSAGASQDHPHPLPPLKTSTKASISRSSSAASSPTVGESTHRKTGGTVTGYVGTAGRKTAFRPNAAKMPAQNASVTTHKTPSTAKSSDKPTSAPDESAKANRLTATRTRKPLPTSSTNNVFTSGARSRKKRSNLGDVMADPSKQPKAFPNMRITNLARKRGIERGEAVGALSSIPKGLLLDNEQPSEGSRRPSQALPPSTSSLQNEETPNPPVSPAEPEPTPDVRPQPSADPTIQTGVDELLNLKPKKSVHFTEENDDVWDGTMDGLFSGDTEEQQQQQQQRDSDKTPIVDKEIPAATKTLQLAAYQEHVQTRTTIQKLVRFGVAEPIEVGFTSIDRHTAAWLTAFKAIEVLHLKHTCTSYHLRSQVYMFMEEKLSFGTIEATATEHDAAVKNVAVSLQRKAIGLHFVAREYSVLVYATDSDDWDWLRLGTKSSTPGSPLRYCIYKSPHSLEAYPSDFYDQPRAFRNLLHPNGINDSKLIGLLTGLGSADLLPQDARFVNKQTFMLLIPIKARQLLATLMAWLRVHHQDRPIFTVEQSNSWRLFHEDVQAGAGGTIISHANFTKWNLKKIPYLWRMLEDGRYTFWHLETGEHKQPQYPSDTTATSEPGTLQLTRLFPFGRAFLITPSFVISDPTRLCMFLRWFQQYAHNPGHIIVTCHDFPLFLKNIIDEKQREHDTLKRVNNGNDSLDKHLLKIGRSQQDICDHLEALQLLQGIMETFGDEERSEEIRKVHWLSEVIDPNDEQSLVNAFCWWTQLKCDRYRRFYVLGSDPNKIHRAYRYLEIPRYRDTEHSDPDVARILAAAEIQKEPHQPEFPTDIAWGGGIGERRTSTSEAAFRFPGTLLPTDSVHQLQEWMDNNQYPGFTFLRLHAQPVSWTDQKMAAQFGDQNARYFDSFSDWLRAAPVFQRKCNTWLGLFYTITDNWDEFTPKRQYERHPWIAILRPKNCHMITKEGEFETFELLIWDIAATDRGRFGDCLLDMQRQLIDHVHEHITDYYPGHPLSDVWYGSATSLFIGPQDNPLDITCRRILELYNNTRQELAPFNVAMWEKWTAIDRRRWEAGTSPMALKTKPKQKAIEFSLERVPQTEEDLLKPEKVIWHPVSGEKKDPGTKCLNDLHEACLKARLKDPQCDYIRYQYRSTVDWWADQVAEGRYYGYVCVGAAAKLMERLIKSK